MRKKFFLTALFFVLGTSMTTASIPAHHPPAEPDLVITDVTITDGVGPDIGFSITFKNQGDTSTANYFLLRVYLSSDPVITVVDYQINQLAYAYYMTPGEEFTYTKTNLTVHGVPTGSYYLGAIIDSDYFVPESDETNNSAYDDYVCVAITAQTDITVQSVDLNLLGGSLVQYRLTIENPSLEPAVGHITYGAFLSTDTDITTSDHGLREFGRNLNLPSTFTYTSPFHDDDISLWSIPPGTYYLGFIIDLYDEMWETDETNNAGYDNNPKVVVTSTGIFFEPVDRPSQFDLFQNHPNPFNAGTAIAYQLPAETDVRMTVFDIRGTVLLTHHPGRQPPGEYTFLWNGLDQKGAPLPSGLYFCRLEAGEFTKTIRMLMMR